MIPGSDKVLRDAVNEFQTEALSVGIFHSKIFVEESAGVVLTSNHAPPTV